MGATPPAGQQICSHCGEPNVKSSAFCKECGHVLNDKAPGGFEQPKWLPKEEPRNRTKSMKLLRRIVAVVAILMMGAGGGYYWYNKKLHQDARDYFKSSSQDFSQVINGINALSTDKELDAKETENQVLLQAYEEEKTKSEMVALDINTAQDNLNKKNSNKLTASIDAALRQFYTEAQEQTKAYQKLTEYNLTSTQELVKFSLEMEKLRNQVPTVNSSDELRMIFVSMRNGIDNANNNIKQLQPPNGLEEAHQKTIDLFTTISLNLTDVVKSLDEKNTDNFAQSIDALSESFSDNKKIDEIDSLYQYHFDELHKEFVGLREKADQIKSEFITYKATLGAPVTDINIEGW